ncbi:MAG: hypothetical protein Q9184_000041 [Pyrenodesmia sp. 2 TL-2023]
MSLLGKLPDRNTMRQTTRVWPTAEPIERLLGWLVSRQTSVLREEENSGPVETGSSVPTGDNKAQISIQAEDHPVMAPNCASPDECGIEPSEDELQFAGFTGRCNKAADTCYAFWAGGSLKVCSYSIHSQGASDIPQILNSLHLIDQEVLCQYLLSKTQHKIGGFGKFPGEPPGTLLLNWLGPSSVQEFQR